MLWQFLCWKHFDFLLPKNETEDKITNKTTVSWTSTHMSQECPPEEPKQIVLCPSLSQTCTKVPSWLVNHTNLPKYNIWQKYYGQNIIFWSPGNQNTWKNVHFWAKKTKQKQINPKVPSYELKLPNVSSWEHVEVTSWLPKPSLNAFLLANHNNPLLWWVKTW